MRFVQFAYKGSATPRVGVHLEEGVVVDLVSVTSASKAVEVLKEGQELIEKAEKCTFVDFLIQKVPTDDVQKVIASGKFRIPMSEVDLLAPVTNPDKVICIGMNYKDHCEEQNAPVPTEPVVFNKFPSCVVGPYDDLPHPDCTKELDWEVELTIVIGKQGRNISEADAMDHVFGYTVAHDVSARDWQLKRNGGQWLIGKAMDAFCPLGPAVVTKDEIGDPHNLNLSCSVNGVIKQNSNTNQLVFKTEELVAWVSQFCTLYPGDLILTGTPPGVGVFMKPPQFLKKGDVVECYIEKIGTIKNKVV